MVLSLGTGVKAATVSSVWALGAYRRLAKPYRKNVKHIVLVQPSAWARALLAMAQPFVSKKAAHKVKKVGEGPGRGRGSNNPQLWRYGLGWRGYGTRAYQPPVVGWGPYPLDKLA